jgi:hypothetical protein
MPGSEKPVSSKKADTPHGNPPENDVCVQVDCLPSLLTIILSTKNLNNSQAKAHMLTVMSIANGQETCINNQRGRESSRISVVPPTA